MHTDLTIAIDAFDALAYVQERGADEEQPGQWALDCPTCGRRKLIVDVKKKVWHCWFCQQKARIWTTSGYKERVIAGAGSLVDLIQLLDDVPRQEAVQVILMGNVSAVDLAQLDAQLEAPLPPKGQAPEIPWPPFAQDIVGTLSYCEQRGITPQDVQAFKLRWCPAGKYANRLVFPVFEAGRLVYWQARAMWSPAQGEHFVKSLNPWRSGPLDTVSGDVLLNLDQARQYPEVVITEGPIDAIHVGPDAVCSFGKKLSSTQVAKLIRAGVRRVALMWDGPTQKEPGGAYQEMASVASIIAPQFDSVRVVRLPQGDPGDWPRAQLRAFLDRYSYQVGSRSFLEAL